MKNIFIWFLLIIVAWLSWQLEFANLHVAEADGHNAQMIQVVAQIREVDLPPVYNYNELKLFCEFEYPAQELSLKTGKAARDEKRNLRNI